jgi:predicted secreted protein
VERSKKIIFVAHCLLNQNVLPVGMERAAGAVKELVELLAEAGVGIIQLPAIELEFGGLESKPKPKEAMDTKSVRGTCRTHAKAVFDQIKIYLAKNYQVLAILGVESSPIYAVHQLVNGNRNIPGKGIFIEELEDEMRKRNFQVPIIGVNLNNLFSTMEKIQNLLVYS